MTDTYKCPECSAPEHQLLDDVVTGDTVCTQCGLIVDDRSAGLFSSEHNRYVDYNADRPINPLDDRDEPPTGRVCEHNAIVAASRNTASFDTICDNLLKQLSRYCVEITRNNRIILSRLCNTVAEKHPEMLFKAPASIVLAVFVCYTKPTGRLRGLSHLSADQDFVHLCNSLHVKPSSVYGVLRKVDRTIDHALYSRRRGRSTTNTDR